MNKHEISPQLSNPTVTLVKYPTSLSTRMQVSYSCQRARQYANLGDLINILIAKQEINRESNTQIAILSLLTQKGGLLGTKRKCSPRWQPRCWQGISATLVATNAATQVSIGYVNKTPFSLTRHYRGNLALDCDTWNSRIPH